MINEIVETYVNSVLNPVQFMNVLYKGIVRKINIYFPIKKYKTVDITLFDSLYYSILCILWYLPDSVCLNQLSCTNQYVRRNEWINRICGQYIRDVVIDVYTIILNFAFILKFMWTNQLIDDIEYFTFASLMYQFGLFKMRIFQL